MISFVAGVLAEKRETHAVVDVGGVGFKAEIPLTTYRELPREGESVTLRTHLHLREDEIRLFGFMTGGELMMFELLLGVSGVGARMALDIVSHLPVGLFVKAVQEGDTALLCRAPGVGKKRAERLVFDLKGSKHPLLLAPPGTVETGTPPTPPAEGAEAEAADALVALGLQPQAAHRAVRKALETLGKDAGVQELIKEGLRRR